MRTGKAHRLWGGIDYSPIAAIYKPLTGVAFNYDRRQINLAEPVSSSPVWSVP